MAPTVVAIVAGAVAPDSIWLMLALSPNGSGIGIIGVEVLKFPDIVIRAGRILDNAVVCFYCGRCSGKNFFKKCLLNG